MSLEFTSRYYDVLQLKFQEFRRFSRLSDYIIVHVQILQGAISEIPGFYEVLDSFLMSLEFTSRHCDVIHWISRNFGVCRAF